MHIRPDIDEGAVREVLKELMDLLEPRNTRWSFAQRVSEICMILESEVWLTEGPLNNLAGILGITNLTVYEIDDRLKEIVAGHVETIAS